MGRRPPLDETWNQGERHGRWRPWLHEFCVFYVCVRSCASQVHTSSQEVLEAKYYSPPFYKTEVTEVK